MMLVMMSSGLLLLSAGMCWWLASATAGGQASEAALAQPHEDPQRHVRELESRLVGGGRLLWRRQRHNRAWLAQLALILRQAGFIGTRAQWHVLLAMALLVFGVFAGGLLQATQQGLGWPQVILNGLGWAALAAVAAWLWLKQARRRRTAKMDEEAEMLIQVTRMLWDSGMTLEGVLRGLIHNLDSSCRESVRELRLVLLRIEAGQAREEVLEEIAEIQLSAGLQDMCKLLAQISASGGGARQSLSALSELIRDRRRTRIQETVTKLSGKMSLVMMVFLFPALLIVLAGPAVINLAGLFDALGS
ncbi:hypothetical protein BWR19_07860 [Halomonas sp. 1513]|nr:type II secretion system F family protein [Halomonas sp. 1513]APX92851.1 hypothetical protein BWR19_07860 [Halomonas sp. 1513]